MSVIGSLGINIEVEKSTPAGQLFKKRKMKKFTWNDLAEAISKLSEDQKKKQVLVSIGDGSHFQVIEGGLDVILQDIWVHTYSEEDCAPLEDLRDLHGEEFNQQDYKLATPAGTPFLWDGF